MQINVNGQDYDSWESVPAELRQQLAAALPDADRNGIPDLFETGALPTAAGTFAATTVTVNGSTVSSLDQLPPEVREQLHRVFGWALPGQGAVPQQPGAPGAPGAPTGAPVAPMSTPPPRLEPGQVMLNGVPTTVEEATSEKKSWWRRLLGG